MDAHVTSTDFLAGTKVGLYPPQTRPEPHNEPIETQTVPDSGQVVFERDTPRERFWLAGETQDGRWKTVQAHSKPGDPVDVAAVLSLTRPEDHPVERVIGPRTTADTVQHRRRRSSKKAEPKQPAPRRTSKRKG